MPAQSRSPLHTTHAQRKEVAPGTGVFLVSLGCAKNRVDSEHILGLLDRSGFHITEKISDADLAIINTCGFIEDAVKESIGTILEVAREKGKGRLKRLFVVGCLVQRYGYKLGREIPEVDGWLGTGEIPRIVDLVWGKQESGRPSFLMGMPGFLADHRVPRLATTPFYSAYLKISEGCSHRCSYCTIPRLRGPFRSRSPESIRTEAQGMADRGVMEINLVAQDTTMYGKDLGKGACLEDLLEELLKVRRIGWIRVLYAHPHRISDRLLDLLEREEHLCPYLDVPLQHVNSTILLAMGRVPIGENARQLVERIRAKSRPIALRSTLMVGFPGETEKSFQELYDFVRWAAIDHLGVFVFSSEKGTKAGRLRGAVKRKVAEERREALMRMQASISRRKNQALVGHILPVLIEGKSEETELLLTGRTATMGPEVDGQVLISEGHGVTGRVAQVLIKEAHVYDLVGEIVPSFLL